MREVSVADRVRDRSFRVRRSPPAVRLSVQRGLAALAGVAVALLLVPDALAAQADAVVRGRVVDQAGDPLADAVVEVVGGYRSVVTGADGRFELRLPSSDGARFAWRAHEQVIPEAGEVDFVELNWANDYLPEESSGNGLAYEDLEPRDTYELEIETEGVVLRGRTTIPEIFTVSVRVQDGHRIAVWPRVRGAGGYLVSAEGHDPELQRDTTYLIPADVPAGARVGVRAPDENLFRYLADDRVSRAGIDRGYGVFGAVVWADAVVPARP